jgi:hypothetical protein
VFKVLQALMVSPEQQERQELVYLEQQALTELLVLKVQLAQQVPELREPQVPLGLVQVEQQAQQALLVLVLLEQLARLVMTEQLEPRVLRAQTEQLEPQVLVLLELLALKAQQAPSTLALGQLEPPEPRV